jgi:hypothetical protein
MKYLRGMRDSAVLGVAILAVLVVAVAIVGLLGLALARIG